MTLAYQSGFASELATEALEGALPVGRNSPQRASYGLYAEQLSGTAFTAPRHANRRTWMYRIRPAVLHGPFSELAHPTLETAPFPAADTSPNQMRWDPFPIPEAPTDFVDGLVTIAGNGDAAAQAGIGIHVYGLNRPMHERFFYDADGELLLVPQQGRLVVTTELGALEVAPGEIALLPRGMAFRIAVDGPSRVYVCENYGAPFRLPELGPIGSNGLANPRDFLAPTAAFEDRDAPTELVCKLGGRLWSARLAHSPLDVVAWHGNYYPYKYDLARFNAMNSVTYDHPDPSIFTVLTAPSDTPGMANLDFVIFPPRWSVAEGTFRPPYFHRNLMSELMGLVRGEYDAKQGGFVPGGASLHNAMSAHGPDRASYEQAIAARLEPRYLGGTLAFMFESRYAFEPTAAALASPTLERGYDAVWGGFDKARVPAPSGEGRK